MKILITNHWLKKLGGSETFTYTMAGELIRRGHKVDLYSRVNGYVAMRIQKDFKIKSVLSTEKLKYDLILANHKSTIDDVRLFTQGFLIQTCHGTTPVLEQPNLLADSFVAISEEVQQHIWDQYKLQSDVINNGIDCTRFKPHREISNTIKKVLSLSHSNSLNFKLAQYFHKKGIDFICHNKYSRPVWNTEQLMNSADLVISLGRGAYEAMACGRVVLVLDHRSYSELYGEGLITKDNFFDLMICNCSGRRFKRTDLKGMLDEAIDQYSPDIGKMNRELACENLDIRKQVKKYIQLYEQY